MRCVIVGGGLIGLLQARFLCKAGWQVTVIDQGDIGQEASWAGGGILSPLYPWRYPRAVTQLAQCSQRYYPHLVRELIDEGGVDPELTTQGMVMLGVTDASLACDWAAQWGQVCEPLDSPSLHRLLPGFAGSDTSALWWPRLAQIRNPRLVKALKITCARAGVEFITHQPVIGLLSSHQTVWGVSTVRGDIPAERVIVCSGAWSGRFLEGIASLPVKPMKGQMLLLRGQPGEIKPIVLSHGRYVIPRRDGRLLVGSTLEDQGFDKQPTLEARESLSAFAQKLFPGLQKFTLEQHWAGLRPGNPRGGIPYIGKVPAWEHLYINTGHFRNGIVLAPASAQLLTDLLLERPPGLDPTPYQLDGGNPVAIL
ncbi:MAG: glycine oxidase ThiO [Gammaproteobacteria bacterium]|nr:glycine oxidase ThiO [Gammaproteobacteria bacterium]